MYYNQIIHFDRKIRERSNEVNKKQMARSEMRKKRLAQYEFYFWRKNKSSQLKMSLIRFCFIVCFSFCAIEFGAGG